MQFEAVPQDSSDNAYFCSWFASLVWKGRKPFEENPIPGSTSVGVSGRRGSIGSTGSAESNSTEGSDSLTNNQVSNQNIVKTGPQSTQVLRGRGHIARIVNESCGLIWWVLQPNHLQSVWFHSENSSQDLRHIFKQGDPVKFIAVRSAGGPTHWVAKEIFSDSSPSILGAQLVA